MLGFPGSSPTNSELYLAIEDFVSTKYPSSELSPSVSTGFTDSRFSRGIGIAIMALILIFMKVTKAQVFMAIMNVYMSNVIDKV